MYHLSPDASSALTGFLLLGIAIVVRWAFVRWRRSRKPINLMEYRAGLIRRNLGTPDNYLHNK